MGAYAGARVRGMDAPDAGAVGMTWQALSAARDAGSPIRERPGGARCFTPVLASSDPLAGQLQLRTNS